MNDLLKLAIEAHGGLDRWNSLHTVAADLSIGGTLWSLKRQDGLFADGRYEADTHEQRATLRRFGAPDRRVLVLRTCVSKRPTTGEPRRFAEHAFEIPAVGIVHAEPLLNPRGRKVHESLTAGLRHAIP